MIVHKKCDIFESGADIICHQVNCQGVMGSGLAKQVREKYPEVYQAYKTFCINTEPEELLGKVQCVYIDGDNPINIINIFGQLDYGYNGKCYTDYDALRYAFKTINEAFQLCDFKPILAFPYKFGCARGGGDWNIVYKMIEETFQDCMVFVCEYDGG